MMMLMKGSPHFGQFQDVFFAPIRLDSKRQRRYNFHSNDQAISQFPVEIKMQPSSKSNTKPLSPTIVKDAMVEATKKHFNQAIVTEPSKNSVSVSAFVTGTAQEAVQAIIVDEAKNLLCRSGYQFSCKKSSSAPGKAEFLFDFNTEKGKERVAVGVIMDTDRASYVVKRMKSFLP